VPDNGIGEATKTTDRRKYKIIERSDAFYVKKRVGPFYFFIRTKLRKIKFHKFCDVVKCILKRKKEDNRGH